MNDNIFANWFKEFCSLVFIQTIQAFIFAIVMALIISVMTPENVQGTDRSDYVAATGVIAVIALASISKLEELVKKIIGVKSSITDPGMKGGMKSLATTMMAASLAKGVLDNAGKFAGGVGGAFVANRKMNQARTDMAKKLKTSNSNSGSGDGNSGSTSGDYLDRARQALESGNMDDYTKNMNMYEGARNVEKNANANSGADKKKDLSKAYEDYENKMEELRDKRRKSLFNIAKGTTETIGAIGGGITGLTIGAAAGESKDMLNYGLAGMGIGDKVGAIPVKAIETGSNIGYEVNKIVDERRKFVSAVENINQDAKDAINRDKRLRTKYSKARQELDKQMSNFDISDL